MKQYIPAPVDTSGIAVTPEILIISEAMAKNTHEVWAAGRMAEGWSWGPVRDDQAKKHPGLVPYEELSEEEKEYDRRTSMETLKLLLSLGYRLEKYDDNKEGTAAEKNSLCRIGFGDSGLLCQL